jgi:Beta propeller domain
MHKELAIQLVKCVIAGALAFGAHGLVSAQDMRIPEKNLLPFASEIEFLAYFEPFAAERQRQHELQRQRQEEARLRQEAARRKWEEENPGKTFRPAPTPPPAPAAAAPAAAPTASSESITNSQTSGVDEGGIVKVHGKHLVILRRGRLFTVNVDRHMLKPVSTVEAFGSDVEPSKC